MTPDHIVFNEVAFALTPAQADSAVPGFLVRFGATTFLIDEPIAAGPDDRVLAGLGGDLMTARLDGIVLLSGAGTGQLLERAGGLAAADRFLHSLADIRYLAAGPSAARVLERRSIRPSLLLDSLDDWRPLLEKISALPDLGGTRLAIESSRHDLPLQSGLESRGVQVQPLPLVCPPVGKTAGCGSGNAPPDRATIRSPQQNQPPDNPELPLAAILFDVDDIATVMHWIQHSPTPCRHIRLFSPSGVLVEQIRLLGLEAWQIAGQRALHQWSVTEALEIARHLW